MSEQFLFADRSDEFLEVERLEVSHVAEVLLAEFGLGRGEHGGGCRIALAEAGVRMVDHSLAFAGSVADEKAWTLLQILCKTVFVDYDRCCFGELDVGGRSFASLRMTEYCGVHLHAAGIYHRDDIFV